VARGRKGEMERLEVRRWDSQMAASDFFSTFPACFHLAAPPADLIHPAAIELLLLINLNGKRSQTRERKNQAKAGFIQLLLISIDISCVV
jgi:hypothetical protein